MKAHMLKYRFCSNSFELFILAGANQKCLGFESNQGQYICTLNRLDTSEIVDFNPD